jgi:DNA repair protein RadC
MLTKGAQTLSDAELLSKFGGLRGLLSQEPSALKAELGLGPAKVATSLFMQKARWESIEGSMTPITFLA